MVEKIIRRLMGIPVITMTIALACVTASVFPGLCPVVIFDRHALLSGEIWRLFTGHLVHFSEPHLMYNLLVFVVSGYFIEKEDRRLFGYLCFWLALVIGMSLLILKPDMAYYGGLSGIACGVLYYLAMMGLKRSKPWQVISLMIVFVVPVKIAIEIYDSASLLPYWVQQSFVPMHSTHMIGCAFAVLFYRFQSKGEKRINRQVTDEQRPCGYSVN